jgi:hypothetical protein
MQNKIRQLAAIMFTDMVGYTALMQVDEKKAKINRDKHRKILEKDISLLLDYAIIYEGLNDYDKVFYYLEKAAKERHGGLLFVKTHPNWEKFHNDPRFNKFMKKIGLGK